MKPEAPQPPRCPTCGSDNPKRAYCCIDNHCGICPDKFHSPVAAQPEPEAVRCPQCFSMKKGEVLERCYRITHSWHDAAPSESVAPPKQTDDAMIQSSCPDKQIIWFHGTTRIAALVIEREGFKEGTWFAAHMEDALEFGGPIVFSVKVTFPPERAYAWQVCCINAIPASAIIKRTELFTVVGGIVAQTPVAQPTPPQVDTWQSEIAAELANQLAESVCMRARWSVDGIHGEALKLQFAAAFHLAINRTKEHEVTRLTAENLELRKDIEVRTEVEQGLANDNQRLTRELADKEETK